VPGAEGSQVHPQRLATPSRSETTGHYIVSNFVISASLVPLSMLTPIIFQSAHEGCRDISGIFMTRHHCRLKQKTTLGGVKVFDPDFVRLEILRP